jgi:hypothetical protein
VSNLIFENKTLGRSSATKLELRATAKSYTKIANERSALVFGLPITSE